MTALAQPVERHKSQVMGNVARLDADTAWAAFMRRDRSWDGRVIGAVKTTGIYCKPSCPARRPKRENVEFFATREEALAAGYRPCMRCKPDEVGRDREAIARAVKLIEEAADYVDRVPPVFEKRILSLRGFDENGMMADAILTQPGEADAGIRKLFANDNIVSIHAHNATRGCFAARIERN